MSLFIFLPLLASFTHGLSSLFLKRGFEKGAGFGHSLFVANLFVAAASLVLLGFQKDPIAWSYIHFPLITACFFVIGQATTFIAIRKGDLSAVAPTLGAKVILVALIGHIFFRQSIDKVGWGAVLLAGVAVGLIGITPDRGRSRRSTAIAIAWALLSCSLFALCDQLMGAWSPYFGKPGFITFVFLASGIYSFALIPFFSTPLRSIPRESHGWLATGACLLGLQALILAVSLTYSNPTVANTVYASRGLWTVLLVATIGGWFGNSERQLAPWILIARLGGSLLVLVAIYLMLFIADVGN